MQQRRSTRNRFVAIGIAGALVFTLAACGGDDDAPNPEAGTKDAGKPATQADLESQTWQLRSYVVNEAGDLQEPNEDPPATAKFATDSVSGSTGCNQYNATYQLTDVGAISFSQAAVTKMACPGDLAQQEQAFLQGLENAKKAVMADDALQMLDA